MYDFIRCGASFAVKHTLMMFAGLGEAQSQICQLQELLEQIRNLPISAESSLEVSLISFEV